uniref:Amino acid transporter transmembrane domain-containing protein n=1 Tax=Timema monikensis TaxID=170555 RepID=A0A7R9ECI8_9NEOP|nr:unnamed protein product [Timema monikensis]
MAEEYPAEAILYVQALLISGFIHFWRTTLMATGLVYVFNLIVGTGALTLPSVFNQAGWALGVSLIMVLAVISFITVTFVIESMAAANAIVQWKRLQQMKRVSHIIQAALQASESQDEDSEDTPLFSPELLEKFPSTPHRYYLIQERIEMGQMATLFFSRFGCSLFFLCFAVYLYGDLTIYSAAVSKSLYKICFAYHCDVPTLHVTTCRYQRSPFFPPLNSTYHPSDLPCNSTVPENAFCWEGSRLTRLDAYRIFLAVFLCTLGPFVFFNVQKTKYLQMLTTLMRWLAFSIMIVYAARKLIYDGPQGHPPAASLSGVPGLFGACVYSFMCHHSLPALVSPIADKTRLSRFLALDYVLIAAFYLLLALTGAFAFQHLDDLYTLDFGPRANGDCGTGAAWPVMAMEYFLALFPVFTLSTSFPIIAITLRNNLKSLFLTEGRHYHWCIRKMAFPLLAVIPPVLIATTTENLEILVRVTGSYAGASIQYIIPALLVYYARQKTLQVIGMGVKNEFASPFHSCGWVWFVILWAIACSILVTIQKQMLWFLGYGHACDLVTVVYYIDSYEGGHTWRPATDFKTFLSQRQIRSPLFFMEVAHTCVRVAACRENTGHVCVCLCHPPLSISPNFLANRSVFTARLEFDTQ